MKVLALVVLVIVACAVDFSEAGLPGKTAEYLKEDIISCGAKEGAARYDIDLVVSGESPSSHQAKCVLACAAEGSGMVKDKKIDLDGMESLEQKIYGDINRTKLTREMSTECVGITDEDRCEAAYKIVECMNERARARGLTTKV